MIRIDEEFSITVDGDNSYLLVRGEPKTTIDKKGKKRVNLNIVGYFSNLTSLLNRYLDLQVKRKIDNETVTTLKELMEEIKKLKAFTNEAYNLYFKK